MAPHKAVDAIFKDRQTQEEILDLFATRRMTVEKPTIFECLLSEFVGTFFLVFTIGVSVNSAASAMAPVAIGLMLSIQIYTFGAVSGGMFNPAVALAVLLSGRGQIKPMKAAAYMLVQCLAAIIGALLAFAGTEKTAYLSTGSKGCGLAFELEMFFTMALCMTVLTAGTSNDAPNQYFGFAIGMTVTASAFASTGLGAGSFNPAVTLGLNIANAANGNALGSPTVGEWFLFLLVPLLGGIMAAGVFRGTRNNEYKLRAERG